tara:strand:+ start:67 stop:201 length:135 start_codon:yes stop_codon:yes gene_type:complete
MLDEELMEEMSASLGDVKHIYISSVAQHNITELKDLLWNEINAK